MRGADRERQVADLLARRGWVCIRSAGSHGPVDVIAARDGQMLLVQVKSTRRGPFAGFGPGERTELLAAAERAGGRAVLAWWPPDRRGVRWIPPEAWPSAAPQLEQPPAAPSD